MPDQELGVGNYMIGFKGGICAAAQDRDAQSMLGWGRFCVCVIGIVGNPWRDVADRVVRQDYVAASIAS